MFRLFFVLALANFLVGFFGTSQNKSSNQVSIFNDLFSITSAFIIASENFSCDATVLFSCCLEKIVSLLVFPECLLPVVCSNRSLFIT